MKALIQLTVALALFLHAFASANASPSQAFEGRKIYMSHCMICHGIDGKGKGPLAQKMKLDPEDLTTYAPSYSDTYLQRIIAGDDRDKITRRSGHGDISDKMPRWSSVFNPEQVKSLVAYLRYLSNTKHTLPGDPELGFSLYQKYCSICHGTDGDGNGVLSDLIGIKPIDHTNPQKTDKLDNASLAKSIIEGEGEYMPGWRDILRQHEVDALVSYIRLLYQIWGKLDNGGHVIVLGLPGSHDDNQRLKELLTDPTCSGNKNLTEKGLNAARRLGNIFQSRGVPVQRVITSPYCLAIETAQAAFNTTETKDYLMHDIELSDVEIESQLEKLEHLVGSYSGKENLILITDRATLESLSFQKVEDGYFLVLMPMGGSQYDEVGIYRYDTRP